MTLQEISVEYRANEQRVKDRIKELEAVRAQSKSTWEKSRIDGYIKHLSCIQRECREVAIVCERYYERGYRRNGKYTV